MIVKVKKRHNRGFVRLMGGGEIKEVLVNADLIEPTKKKISICFRGKADSGIIELSNDEAKDLQETLKKELNVIKDVKVIKEIKKRK
ncbi:MAG: hypothetical protein PHF67_01530 [Candidatus Nanoarchaeia archaeon]|nr:hypothetical protein [Candidatus Nanoarchaeia archaeon]